MKLTEEMIDKAVAEVREELASYALTSKPQIDSLDDISKLGESFATSNNLQNEFTVRLIKKLFVNQDLDL